MGIYSYPDEERTIHHGRPRASNTAKLFRYVCEVLLFFTCLAVVGGIIMGVIALNGSVSVNDPEVEGVQARDLFARSYYGNITAGNNIASGNINPTGSAPVYMNNATGAAPSGSSPSITITIGGVGAAQATTEVQAANQTDVFSAGAVSSGPSPSVTLTVQGVGAAQVTTEVQATNQTDVFSAAAVSTGVYVSEPSSDCAPAAITVTVTKVIGGAPSAEMNSTAKAVAPVTTLIIPDLYSKEVKVDQTTLAPQGFNATSESDLTTTVTVFEQSTVIITSTKLVGDEYSSSPANATGQLDTENSPCMSENATAAGVSSMTNGTVLQTITVQPAPLPTQTASSDGDSPVIVSEGAPSKQGKLGGTIVSGFAAMMLATILCML